MSSKKVNNILKKVSIALFVIFCLFAVNYVYMKTRKGIKSKITLEDQAKLRWDVMMKTDCRPWIDDPTRKRLPDECYGQMWYVSGCRTFDNGTKKKFTDEDIKAGRDTWEYVINDSRNRPKIEDTESPGYSDCHVDTGFDYTKWGNKNNYI
jgi:hypothetical protein